MTPADADPIAVALAVTSALDALGIANTVGGSIASSYAGEPRSTIGIDIVAAIESRHVKELVSALSADFYIDDKALQRAIHDRSSANLIHQPSMLKVDLFIAGGRPSMRSRLRGVDWCRLVLAARSACIRRKISSCRNCAGTASAAKFLIVSGEMSWASYARKAAVWISTTCGRMPLSSV